MGFCGVEFCGRTPTVINGSGTFDAIAAHRVFGAALERRVPVRGVRVQDDHAAPAHGQPAAATVGGARRA